MRLLIVLGVLLVVGLAVLLVWLTPLVRSRSTAERLTEQRTKALLAASEEYAKGRPGLAQEHERTAEALLDLIRRETGDER